MSKYTPNTTLLPSIVKFLKKLQKNNNRLWFIEHKEEYTTEHAHFKTFTSTLFDKMSQYDNLESLKVYRIYRDVRFSKNKTPYKSNFAGGMKRATKWLRGGYYFHIQPGGASMIGGGFWGPNVADLKRIRQEIAVDAEPLRKILADPTFLKVFGNLEGTQLKTAPRDYPKDHPNIDLLRYKQFVVRRHFTDEEVLADDFLPKMIETFRAMRPFFDYMSDVLTTDANGVPIE
ncbi:MAG: hypothetical protein ACI9XO_002967 [Paraglaciecola sp.]|jgi:uncharacterized protein (TIGR02453 family)